MADWWRFLKPPFLGAGLLASYVAIRVFLFAAGGRFAKDEPDAERALVFAAASGGLCGLIYSLLGRPLRRRGALGNYAAGIITVAPYFAFLFFLGPGPKEHADFRDPTLWLGVLVVSVLVGVFLGREFHEKDNLFKEEHDETAT